MVTLLLWLGALLPLGVLIVKRQALSGKAVMQMPVPVEAAYLRGGARLTLAVVLLELLQLGHLFLKEGQVVSWDSWQTKTLACPNCGNTINANFDQCVGCGHPVERVAVEYQEPAELTELQVRIHKFFTRQPGGAASLWQNPLLLEECSQLLLPGLVAKGLAPSEDEKKALLALRNAAMVGITLTGAVYVGIWLQGAGFNLQDWLVAMLGVMLNVFWIVHADWRGKTTPQAMRWLNLNRKHWHGGKRGDNIAMGFALKGAGSLEGSVYAELVPEFKRDAV